MNIKHIAITILLFTYITSCNLDEIQQHFPKFTTSLDDFQKDLLTIVKFNTLQIKVAYKEINEHPNNTLSLELESTEENISFTEDLAKQSIQKLLDHISNDSIYTNFKTTFINKNEGIIIEKSTQRTFEFSIDELQINK